MLVLSRAINESLMIGNDIKVMVVDIRGDKVRLGVDAPDTISVHRQEVYDAIKRDPQLRQISNTTGHLADCVATLTAIAGAHVRPGDLGIYDSRAIASECLVRINKGTES